MAKKNTDLSKYNLKLVPSAKEMSFGIVVSEWNNEITSQLLDGAYKTLLKHGVEDVDITVKYVPGTFEIPFAAKALYDSSYFDAIICLGCVVQGETKHFDYICQGVTQGITSLNIKCSIPFIFGILTTDNIEQARERAGGSHGNKGVEAAVTAIKMVALNNELMDGSFDDEDEFDEYFDDEFLN